MFSTFLKVESRKVSEIKKKNLIFRNTYVMGSERENFQLKEILGLLCVHFDAAVVFVMKFSTLFRFTLAILWMGLLTSLSPAQLNYGCWQGEGRKEAEGIF